jgi:hypothetical protein
MKTLNSVVEIKKVLDGHFEKISIFGSFLNNEKVEINDIDIAIISDNSHHGYIRSELIKRFHCSNIYIQGPPYKPMPPRPGGGGSITPHEIPIHAILVDKNTVEGKTFLEINHGNMLDV